VLPAIASSSNGRLVAIASRNRARAEEMASGHAGARVLESYDAVLADPEVDAVYIPLVNDLHKPWTMRALDAGKHVLCEKPLAMDAVEAEEMAAAAHSSGKVLMEAFMYRFHPRVKDFVARLHEPMYVQASFGFRLDDAAN
jgi:xylose dehydrogenase (NAD/NADP)